MKFNYKLSRLCGTAYGSQGTGGGGGGNVLFDSAGEILYSPVANRVQAIDLVQHSVRTLPLQTRSNVRRMALSPDDRLLLVADVDNYALLANVSSSRASAAGGGAGGGGAVVLHRFRFKNTVRCLSFSPDGRHFAVSCGKHVQVWRSPSRRKEFAPFVLHRTYTGINGDVIDVSWSDDSSGLIGCGRDNTARIWTLYTTTDYVPVTLAGHRAPLVGAYFAATEAVAGGGSGVGVASSKTSEERRYYPPLETVYTISSDGAVITWKFDRPDDGDIAAGGPSSTTMGGDDADEDANGGGGEDGGNDKSALDAAVDFFTDKQQRNASATRSQLTRGGASKTQARNLVGGRWRMSRKHFIHPPGNDERSSTVTSASMDPVTRTTLVLGFSSGTFGLYEMPECSNVHTLSVSTGTISTVTINRSAEWLAFGCPSHNQLLVWEWRSETYVLKQQGHDAAGMTKMAYSPDSSVIATGGRDGKVKLWNAASGFCYVTFSEHTAPVTAVRFAKPTVVLSSSLDGTVRAHDLVRYRNFRTLTAPSRVQFASMAVDGSGEIVCAGTMDTFDVYLWNLQTGRVLDVLSGHRGPVSELLFHPRNGTLSSSSWDGTVRLWDVYKKDTVGESLVHANDVVCAAFRPDGKMMCTGTLSGVLHFWKLEDASLVHVIEGQKDIAGGRKLNDRMTSNNNASSRYFTSVCYSADGACVLAGGNSKYVCIYEVSQQILLKKFQISYNRSLDGVLDELNSKNLGDGGPIDTMENSGDEADFSHDLPGAKRRDDGSRKHRVEILTSQVSFSSTGREWAAVSGEGLHIYSLDDDMMFDPIALTEAITPVAVRSNVRMKRYGTALLMSMHLNEVELVRHVLESTPYTSIPHVVQSVGPEHLERLMQHVVTCMRDSPHVEFYVQWCLTILQGHGGYLQRHRPKFMRAFRAMHRVVQTKHDELKVLCDENRYTLEFIEEQALLTIGEDENAVAS